MIFELNIVKKIEATVYNTFILIFSKGKQIGDISALALPRKTIR
jgi:hypothetical protein